MAGVRLPVLSQSSPQPQPAAESLPGADETRSNEERAACRITLVHAPQWSLQQPPLGIAYLTGYLRSQGYEVEQRDLSIELFGALPEHQRYLLESQHHEKWLDRGSFDGEVLPIVASHAAAWVEELAGNSSPMIGFTLLATSKFLTLHMAKLIKERAPQKLIIIGGPQTARYEDAHLLAELPFVDFVVPDEGEESLGELLSAIHGKRDLRTVLGILFRDADGRIVDTGERPLLKRLDELPFPSFADFPLHLYKGLTIPILGSRGCVFSCTFCSETVFWKRFRFRSGHGIYEEMRHQKEVFRTKGFYIVDSLINGSVKELERLCDEIIAGGLEAYWGGKASVRRQMTPPLLKKMYAAGCRNLDYGVESGSQKVVDEMKKQFEIPVAEEVLRSSADAGIEVGVFFLIGFPTEREEDFQETIEFLRRNHRYMHHVTPGYGAGLQRGADIYENRQRYGIEFREDGWHSPDTTPAIRLERLHRFVDECKRLEMRISY